MDGQRVGSALRAIRIRRRRRQAEVAAAAGIPRAAAMAIEAGRLDRVRFGDIRRCASELGGRFDGSVFWQGANLDRMLNRGHAHLHEAIARWLSAIGGWLVVPEVSFSYSGERGVIDIVAWHAGSRTLLVIELKTRFADINDLMDTMDIRARMARRIARGEVGTSHGRAVGGPGARADRRARTCRTPGDPAGQVPARRAVHACVAC